jgi:hypothetical protein
MKTKTKIKLNIRSRIATNIPYVLVAVLTSIIAIEAQAGASESAGIHSQAGKFLSPQTIIFLLVGIVIFYVYLQKMFAVLSNAATTYDLDQQDESKDTFNHSLLGTIISVTLSAVFIWSYGLGALFFYFGPVLCMLSPVALIYCMNQDLIQFKKVVQVNKKQE